MALLGIIPYNIKRFSHHLGNKTLVVEASDLNRAAGREDFVQLHDDACDIGIAVYNPRTGSVTYWYTCGKVTEQGELTAWILQPTNESCRRHPGVQCYTMHILND